jgi:hypothetical protein
MTHDAKGPEAAAPVPPVTHRDLEHINERLERGADRMQSIENRLSAQQQELNRNTELTRSISQDTADIRELMAAARLGFKVLGGLGLVAKWAAPFVTVGIAIYGFWQSLKGGGSR